MGSSLADSFRGEIESYLYKVLVVGNAGVGKTSLVRRYCDNAFTANYKATLGVEFNSKHVMCGRRDIQTQLWDIAGQEIFGHMTRVFYRGAVGAVVVCDATDLRSIRDAKRWKDDIDKKVHLPWSSPIPCLLVVNKLDLGPPVADEDMTSLSDFATENGFAGYAEVSARDGTNVAEAFNSLIHVITKLADAHPLQHCDPSANVVHIQKSQTTHRRLCC
eukprot:TRINITY_DN68006_c0_g1_i1.p1 TRINITY_DN68006_c0_g1~~TRINITY_DN68006_c0_g1_i1.p1  ORF type:complete len:218 (+),score=64.75 TRINITY_DN68006_c0_g1_i1:101-754(+)